MEVNYSCAIVELTNVTERMIGVVVCGAVAVQSQRVHRFIVLRYSRKL